MSNWTRMLTVIALYLIFASGGCGRDDVAGTGSEVEVVAYGYVADSADGGLAGVEVGLFSQAHNPIAVSLASVGIQRPVAVSSALAAAADAPRAVTDTSGYFEFRGVHEGAYAVFARVDWHTFAYRTVHIGQEMCDDGRCGLDTTYAREAGTARVLIPDTMYAEQRSVVVLGTPIVMPVKGPGSVTVHLPSTDSMSLVLYDAQRDSVVGDTATVVVASGDTVAIEIQ